MQKLWRISKKERKIVEQIVAFGFGGSDGHLFPNLPPHLYPKISKIVKKQCKEDGIAYVSFQSGSMRFPYSGATASTADTADTDGLKCL